MAALNCKGMALNAVGVVITVMARVWGVKYSYCRLHGGCSEHVFDVFSDVTEQEKAYIIH